MKFSKKMFSTLMSLNLIAIPTIYPLLINNKSINETKVDTYSSNEVVSEGSLIESKEGPINYQEMESSDKNLLIPGTSINQTKKLMYLSGKYPLSGENLPLEEKTLNFDELVGLGFDSRNLEFNDNKSVSAMLSGNVYEDKYAFAEMRISKEVIIPFNKIIDSNRMDIFYDFGSDFTFNFWNRFKSNNVDYYSDETTFSYTVTPDDLKSEAYIQIPQTINVNFDIDLSTDLNFRIAKDGNLSISIIPFVNKDGFKFRIETNDRYKNNLPFRIIADQQGMIQEIINKISGSSLTFLIKDLKYSLRKNVEIKNDDIGQPSYDKDNDLGIVYIKQPISRYLNSPFFISFEPSINSDNGIYNELLFIDNGSGKFEQVGIDPKTGLQTYDFFKIYKDLISQNKLTGKITFRVQIRRFFENGSDYSELTYNRKFEMCINSAQMKFSLYGWNKDKYAEDLKKYITPTIEELNGDKPNSRKKDEEPTPNPYYRDFLDQNTGMYKPKIAWVNSRISNGFLLDPYDENGNKIDSNTEQNKYKIGYIAELNAPGIYSVDLNTNDKLGAVTQIVDVHYTNTEFSVKDEYILDKKKIEDNKITYEKFITEFEEEMNKYSDLKTKKEKAFEFLKKYMKDSDLDSFNVKDPVSDSAKFLVEEIDTSMNPIQIKVKWSYSPYFVNGSQVEEPKTGEFIIKGFYSKIEVLSKPSAFSIQENKISTRESGRSLLENTQRKPISFEYKNGQIKSIINDSKKVIDSTPISPDTNTPYYLFDSEIKNELAGPTSNHNKLIDDSSSNSQNIIQKDHVYQFLKIDNTFNQKEWKEFIDPNNWNNKSIFDWYNYGLDFEGGIEVFVDFWSTTQGYHLIQFLKMNGIIKDGSEVSFMMNADLKTVVNYWKMYVNSAEIQNIEFPDKNDISLIKLNDLYTSESDISKIKEYKEKLILDINNELIKQLNEQFNLKLTEEDLVYDRDYEIVDFDTKVHLLIQNYNNNQYNSGYELKIKSKVGSELILGETSIKIANNPSTKLMLDLNKIKSPTLVEFNTWNQAFEDVVFPETGNIKEKIKRIILESIQTILDRNSRKYSKNFIKKDINYTISFKHIDEYTLIIERSDDINKAIEWLLLNNSSRNNTVTAIVTPIADSNNKMKAFGSAIFEFNNSSLNDVISRDPDIDINNPDINPKPEIPTDPTNPDGGSNGNNNPGESFQEFFKNNISWLIPMIIGIIILVVFIVWAIRVRMKTSKFKV